jgi:hypothetical protein
MNTISPAKLLVPLSPYTEDSDKDIMRERIYWETFELSTKLISHFYRMS